MLGPGWSSVLYLGSLGGPTMVLDQVMEMEKNHPAIPSRGWISSCSSNRWLAFGGDLRHGAVSFGLKEPEPHAPRNVILFNYWKGLRPAPPSCAEPCFQDYLPLCSTSPASAHLLSEPEIARLLEEGLGPKAVEVQAKDVVQAEDMPQCVPVEDLPFNLPLPPQKACWSEGLEAEAESL
ncbi:unnamed protein product [Durusdinium trenchii]|uniref:Uncharacterized protein n=1 Tax=Durusdinium trenchii TaxID=1381693 RepID=A0ABP0IS45_9DINO